jgi:DNA-binding beta-propeller fold protein YncE
MSGTRTQRAAPAILAAAMVLLPGVVSAQADMAPTNSLANPYRTIEGWARMPQGRSFGSSSAVDVDVDGVSIWVAERCGGNIGACTQNPDVDPVMKFDPDGTMVISFGAGMINWPHGIDVDPEGNVWVADGRDNAPAGRRGAPPPPRPRDAYGHQVIKFSPTGQVLMVLGNRGGVPPDEMAAAGPRGDFFWQPNDGEGHGQGRNRVIKFNSRGEYLFEWGGTGDAPGQFNQPHSLAMDSQGRLFVADRGNNRIQIFDQNGRFLDMWYQFSRLSGIYIDQDDMLYGADSESGSVNPDHGAWTRGIRVGSARTGEVMYLIPDPHPDCTGTCTAEGVVADINGVIYGAEVGPAPGRLQRYVRP